MNLSGSDVEIWQMYSWNVSPREGFEPSREGVGGHDVDKMGAGWSWSS